MASKRPKVYLPQMPGRIDPATRLWVPTVDTSQAEKYGECIVLMPHEAGRLRDSPAMLDLMRAKLLYFSEDDFICCVGDPGLIAFAAIAAARVTGGYVKLLKWDRQRGDYIVLEHKP